MEIEKAKEEFRNELIRFKKLVGDLDEKILKKTKVNGDEEHNKILDRLNFINMDIHQWC